MSNKEKEYLNSLIVDFAEKVEDLKIKYSDEKIVVGAAGPDPISELFIYKSLIDTVSRLNFKIKYSLKKAIELAYSKEVTENFSLFEKGNKKEFLAYYYIENCIYRTSTIWDCLAQLYNQYYDIGKNSHDIHYKTFFNNLHQNRKYKSNEKIQEIDNYLKEENNRETEGRWLGNHNYIKKYRNKMTHRNSPDVFTFSNFDSNTKEYPTFILKRLIEDYNKGITFFLEMTRKIMDEKIKK